MCRQEHQSDPASDCAGAKSEHCTAGMNAQVYSDRARSTGCRAGGRSKAITPPFRSITGRPILTFELCSAPRESEAGGDPREEFLEKKRRSRLGYVASSNPGYVLPRHPDFSLLKYRPPILGISDVGLEARVGPMRERIRGAERWTLAGWDDVHRNPDRSSRPAVLL
jgi:hypothetical protein